VLTSTMKEGGDDARSMQHCMRVPREHVAHKGPSITISCCMAAACARVKHSACALALCRRERSAAHTGLTDVVPMW